jgi:threonine synthase
VNFVCSRCGTERVDHELFCLKCGGVFISHIEEEFNSTLEQNFPYISEWIHLGEGNTPMIFDDAIFKMEQFSPTLSYKDRGSVTLISSLRDYLRRRHVTKLNEESSGNAGASIAAYGIAAGFDVNVFVPEIVNELKIKQIESYGATVHRVKGNMEEVTNAARNSDGFMVSHILNPEFRDGMRMISYEIFRDLNKSVPDRIFVPVSGGTILIGIYTGFQHLLNSGLIETLPDMMACQSEQVSPLCHALNNKPYYPPKVISSVADALNSTSPTLIAEMKEIMNKKGNKCVIVKEEEIINAKHHLEKKGISVEYSSAVAYAAFIKEKMTTTDLIVMTGHGIKNLV